VQEIEIRVKGQINRDWSKWLGTLSIAYTPAGESVLSGAVRDQAALYGLMERLSGLGLQLVSVTVRPNTSSAAEEAPEDVTRT
jgi:hypothetical protein